MKETAESLNILLIEDESALARNILDYLTLCGHQTDYASDGKRGLHLALDGRFDVILLDLNLPRMDGISLCQELRQSAHRYTPVLMLTARDSLQDKVEGFEAGADDYLTKPFALAELGLRCQALARRNEPRDNCVEVGSLRLDRRRQQVWREQRLLALNPSCFRLLKLLVESYPAVVSRQQLSDELWPDEAPDADILRSHIYTLRQQLDKPFPQAMLKTVHGVGFVLLPL